MENTYWNSKGKYQVASNRLRELLPAEGSVANPKQNKALERFRSASNCYYDLYNNGLCNRAAEFRRVFGFSVTSYRRSAKQYSTFLTSLFERVDAVMDAIIEDAVLEQVSALVSKQQAIEFISGTPASIGEVA